MRFLALVAAIVFAAVTAPAATYAPPAALLTALYAPYLKDGDSGDYTPFMSPRLNKLLKADSSGDGEGALDFDPVIAGQDYKITKLKFGTPKLSGQTAVVIVTFNNFAEHDTLIYTLVNAKQGWLVDDIENKHGQFPWKL